MNHTSAAMKWMRSAVPTQGSIFPLAVHVNIGDNIDMSATELLDQMKALPANEQAAFARLFHQWEMKGNGSAIQTADAVAASTVQWPDLETRRRRILGRRVLPENIVLAARREERW
jgi:hypothetical protein